MKKLLIFLWLILGALPCFSAMDYQAIDNYAKNAPPLHTRTGLPRLVRYLTQPYQTEHEKARVLLAWIVYNIKYDKSKKTDADFEILLDVGKDPETGELFVKSGDLKPLNSENPIPQILVRRKGICKDIAKLYKHMCQLAGLEAEIISGYACDPNREMASSEAHMWNAVKIGGNWYFVDPTWALEGRVVHVQDEQEAKRIQQQLQRTKNVDRIRGVEKAVDDNWFLVDREQIIQTHFPFERRWQLQRERVRFEDFLKRSCSMTLQEFLDMM